MELYATVEFDGRIRHLELRFDEASGRVTGAILPDHRVAFSRNAIIEFCGFFARLAGTLDLEPDDFAPAEDRYICPICLSGVGTLPEALDHLYDDHEVPELDAIDMLTEGAES